MSYNNVRNPREVEIFRACAGAHTGMVEIARKKAELEREQGGVLYTADAAPIGDQIIPQTLEN